MITEVLRARGPALAAGWVVALGLGGAAGGRVPTSRPARAAAPLARAVVSVAGATLRLEWGAPRKRRVFPVAVGRARQGRTLSPLGRWRTGPDPGDPTYYLPARTAPAFHRGLPFVRLDLERGGQAGRAVRPYGVHGPVTPTLIWGAVTAGCIRMRPPDIRALYRVATRYPEMSVEVKRGVDRLDGRRVVPDAAGPADPRCPERALGVRRLRRLAPGATVHDRLCGGVDHWFAISLSGGELLSVAIQHDGGARLQLYGIRAISPVRSGRFGIRYRLPRVRRNRGPRYVRVHLTRAARSRTVPYTLTVDRP